MRQLVSHLTNTELLYHCNKVRIYTLVQCTTYCHHILSSESACKEKEKKEEKKKRKKKVLLNRDK